jgi:hypothetical protein
MPDCIGVCFDVPGYTSVFCPNFGPSEFVFFDAIGVEALNYGLKLDLIEHRHFGPASPAPEPLHLDKIIEGFWFSGAAISSWARTIGSDPGTETNLAVYWLERHWRRETPVFRPSGWESNPIQDEKNKEKKNAQVEDPYGREKALP